MGAKNRQSRKDQLREYRETRRKELYGLTQEEYEIALDELSLSLTKKISKAAIGVTVYGACIELMEHYGKFKTKETRVETFANAVMERLTHLHDKPSKLVLEIEQQLRDMRGWTFERDDESGKLHVNSEYEVI